MGGYFLTFCDFLLTAKRDTKVAKRFLTKVLNARHTQESQVSNVDKNPTYPLAIEQLQKEERISEGQKTRQVKYLKYSRTKSSRHQKFHESRDGVWIIHLS